MFKKSTLFTAASGATIHPFEQRLRLQSRLRNGANWFYWIAALSVINTILIEFGSTINFVFGLGITQIIDALVFLFGQDFPQESFIVLRIFGWVITLLIILIFVLFGIFANKRQRWAFVAGIIVYALDGLAVLFVWDKPDLFAFVFHLIVIWGLVSGLRAIGQLEKLDDSLRQTGLLPPEPPPSVIQPV